MIATRSELDWWYGWSPAESPREVAETLDEEAEAEEGYARDPALYRLWYYQSWAVALSQDWPGMFPGDPLPGRFVERIVALLLARAE